ncbi:MULTISPECIES: hypothetical protein [unclassified Cobetia]|uniref:hypothetical protein n=1 Tax=unclassified Cobetia TaxID=2609414 RepID=UPI0009E843D8|nr:MULTISPECIES: hypothetical protein [unclassified Cobetia]
MTGKIRRSELQIDKYSYTWSRDSGDGEYAGELDRARIDKDEGYEVLHFIESLMNKLGLTGADSIHEIEDLLHSPSLSEIDMRKDLEELITPVISAK